MFKKASFILAGTLMLTAAIVAVSKPALLDMQAQAAKESGVQAEDSLVRPHSPILGREDAPVTIVEFFDPSKWFILESSNL